MYCVHARCSAARSITPRCSGTHKKEKCALILPMVKVKYENTSPETKILICVCRRIHWAGSDTIASPLSSPATIPGSSLLLPSMPWPIREKSGLWVALGPSPRDTLGGLPPIPRGRPCIEDFRLPRWLTYSEARASRGFSGKGQTPFICGQINRVHAVKRVFHDATRPG